MVTRLFCACIALVAFTASMHAQKVVVSEYFNSNQPAGEWTELLVVADNVSLVRYHLTDWNLDQAVRQGGVTFRDVPLWRHVRAGTILVIHHLQVPGGTQPDTNAADGYLELSRNDGRYFDQFGTNGLDIRNESDILVVLAPDTSHVHALGHAPTPGPGYTNAPPPKVQFDGQINGNDRSVSVIGRSLKSYDARISGDSTALLPGGSKGLPNPVDAVRSLLGRPNVNYWFWRETREPQWSAAPSITVVSQTASSHTIEWTPVVDTYTLDGTTGYVILRDTLNFASFPADGIRDGGIYTAGTRIGTALILAVRPTSTGNRYGDSLNLICGQNYTYRVYGYRYDADQRIPLAQQADTTARGRQYTERLFAQSAVVTKANPAKPTIVASRTQMCPGDTASLTTTSAGPRYEWTVNGQPVPVGGATKIVVFEVGTYRLRVVADGGCFAESDPITISALPASTIDISPTGTQTMCAGDSIVLRAITPAASYQWVRGGQIIAGATSNSYAALQAGDYFVRSQSAQGCPATSPVVRIRIPNVVYGFSSSTLDFGVLGSCASSTSKSIDVINNGTESITISDVTFTSGFSLVSPAPGFVLAPAARQTLRVLFSPSAVGVTNGTATFTALPCNLQRTVSLSGERTQALASINRAAVDFGVYAACDITPTIRPDSIFRVSNNGTSDITVIAPLVKPPFYLMGAPPTKTLAPGEFVDYAVQYSPLGPERDSSVVAEILFPYSATACSDTLRATLKAAAYRPALTIDVSTIDVGALLSCATRIDTFITVTNNALVAATLESSSNPAVSIPDAPLTLDAGISSSVRVTFVAPTTPGPFSVTTNLRVLTCGDLTPLTITGTVVTPAPSFSQSVFDFGIVRTCDIVPTRTQTFRMYMRNAPAAVLTLDLSAPFSTTLSPGVSFSDSVDLQISYTPLVVGTQSDTLRVVLSPCSDTLKLVLFGTFEDPASSTTITNDNFGVLSSGQSVTERLVVRNTGSVNVVVQPLENVAPPFSIVSSTPLLPASIAPGDSAVVLVQYAYAGPGRDDRISIVMRTTGACPSTTTIPIIGTTISSGVITGVVLSLPTNQTARPGDEVAIPISLTSPVNLDSANVTAMHIVVSFDATLLRALRISDLSGLGIVGAVTEATPGRATIDITSTQRLAASQPLIALHGKTYLGRAMQTILRLDTVTAKGLVITGQDGQLTMLGSCAVDALQIALGTPVNLVARYDGTANIVVEFTTLTDEPVTINVVDISGVERLVAIDALVRPATYAIKLNIENFEAGLYLVVMRHGMHMRTAKLMIAP